MQPRYTVILLRPDCLWDGSPADWTYQDLVYAVDHVAAVRVAREHALDADHGEDAPHHEGDTDLREDMMQSYAVLAVYPGHHDNISDF